MTADPVLSLEHVTKKFGPVTVIDGVTVHVRPGHVQVLLGENGAGKSTLIKMMAGIYQPDGGRVVVDGRPVVLSDVRTAESLGIATIHQELNLVPTMSVAENIVLGRMPSRAGLLDRRRCAAPRATRSPASGSTSTSTRRSASSASHASSSSRSPRPCRTKARILILDEPTAALTGDETDALFGVVEELRAAGVAMVFISHHLEELGRIGDSVSVLRDGALVAEVPASTDEDELVRLMVGRDITDHYPRRRDYDGPDEVLLQVDRLSRGDRLRDISLTARPARSSGSPAWWAPDARSCCARSAGADPYDSGEVRVAGRPVPRRGIRAAISSASAWSRRTARRRASCSTHR